MHVEVESDESELSTIPLEIDSCKAASWLDTLLLSYLLTFDFCKAAFWLERAVLGTKFSLCIYFPFSIPLEI